LRRIWFAESGPDDAVTTTTDVDDDVSGNDRDERSSDGDR
jgi:hypothetical protein